VSESPGQLGVHVGSRAPTKPEEVETLLRQVPGMAFVPELAACRFDRAALGPGPSHEELAHLADAAYLARVLDALDAVEQRAKREQNGGLEFLAHTLRHFLTVQKLSPVEHPLVVGLYLRSHAHKAEQPDTTHAIALAMDDWIPG
jgi:hypothetical protein